MSRFRPVLLALVLMLPGVAGALTLNSSAPDFTLSTGTGQPWRLADHLGQERLLIVSRPAQAYLGALVRQAAVLQDRDLRVVVLAQPGDSSLKRLNTASLTVLADPGGTVSARYGRAALIGKDRGVKAVYKALPALNDVLALIDTMPMRLQEQRQRGK